MWGRDSWHEVFGFMRHMRSRVRADLIRTCWDSTFADFLKVIISIVARTPSKEDPYHAAHD